MQAATVSSCLTWCMCPLQPSRPVFQLLQERHRLNTTTTTMHMKYFCGVYLHDIADEAAVYFRVHLGAALAVYALDGCRFHSIQLSVGQRGSHLTT